MAVCRANSKPFVSFIIVARNAESSLSSLLSNYLQQDYPAELRELIIVDGVSEDSTREIAQDFANGHPELAISILVNQKRNLAAGWNMALKVARGAVVCRFDVHSRVPPHYLSKGIQLLQDNVQEGIVCVGGPVKTEGAGFYGKAIAAALSSPFGIGNARFRYAQTPGIVDTVPYGLYWKWVFDKVGLFREDLERNQDVELHARIRRQGWKFYLAPALQTTYQCRSEVGPFLEQAFRNGYWSMVLWRESSWRHLVPFFFVCFLLIFLPLSFFGGLPYYLFLSLGFLYILLAALFAYRSAAGQQNWGQFLILPWLFFLLHAAYGLGSVWTLIHRASRA